MYGNFFQRKILEKIFKYWRKFNLVAQPLIVSIIHSTFQTSTMSTQSLPPIYFLTKLIVEIDFILKYYIFYNNCFACAQFATIASFV